MDSSEEFEQELYDGVDVWDDDECTNAFTTYEVFCTRDELLKWVRKIVFHFGFVIVILRSDTSIGQRGRKTFVLLGCERGGKYIRYKKDLQVTESGIRKCGCPFRLRGYPVKSGEGWILKLICGSHNHELTNTLVDHPYVGRFTCNEKLMLMDMTKSSVKPRNILLTMKEHNEKNVSTIKQVYNVLYMYKKSVRGDRTEMQQLIMLLDRDMYVHWSRFEEGTNVVQDLFWTHPDLVKLLNAFNIVLMMDSTYKTNRYRMPLFEVVGVTSTGLTFSAAFMLLASKRHHNFVWALEKLKGLFFRVDSYPKVVVSDRDIALMNGINVVFPEAVNLLCRFHIDKNVKEKCKMIVYPKEAWDQVMESWGAIVDCENVESYEHRVEAFNVVCSPWPIFTEYVISTWLNPHKEKFVKAWTDKVMHLGNTTSKRTEAAHWSLKRIIEMSMGDLCFCWDSINKMIILQHNAIKSSFEKSLHVVSHVFNVTRYKKLVGFVSKYALQYIVEESDRVEYVGLDKSRCGCTIRSTHGLPCACELASFGVGSIPLHSVHFIWTRLSFLDISSDDTSAKLSIQQEWVVIMNRFNEVDMAGKINSKAKLREIVYPDKTSLCQPKEKVKTKGAQKGR
ncbi:protein FAR-RED IMPAIRED RESPONSE 1-like [Phaseolus vulgaris]|uniref:protein FAR-RED IMPAIRED RESPONSE 1-like n=1 Tax=Phaseolus vulgaris TaxID=3885 RepID=UPI0035CA30BE